jgi:hypothetical protein
VPEPDINPDREMQTVLGRSSFPALAATSAHFAVFAEPPSKYPAIVEIFSFRILP